MKQILWVSQHTLHPVQLAVLKQMFGDDVKVTPDPRPFDSAETIVVRVRDGGYDDCIVVAPYSVLDRMVKLGLRPLWAESEQVAKEQSDWSVGNRYYRFLRFKRVKGLILDLEPLGQQAERTTLPATDFSWFKGEKK